MIKDISVRFFAYALNQDNEVEQYEVTEACFFDLKEREDANIYYERHTVRENGCKQICLTVENDDLPDFWDLEGVQDE